MPDQLLILMLTSHFGPPFYASSFHAQGSLMSPLSPHTFGLVMIVVKLVVSDADCGDSDVSSEILVVLFVEVKLFMELVMII